MKRKLWLSQIPVILFFSFCFWVTELGVQGQLSNAFLREKIHPFLSRAANAFTDLKFLIRGSRPPKNKIVVVEIDSSALERIGRWPWHRDMMAFLIDKTFQAGAKVVGLDIVFSEPDPRVPDKLVDFLKTQKLDGVAAQFETDAELERVVHFYADRLVMGWTSDLACQPVYEEPRYCPVTDPDALKQFPENFDKFSFAQFNVPTKFDPTKTAMISFVTPIANIHQYGEAARHAGYFNAILDSDGFIRRSNLLVMAEGKPFPSLPLEMAKTGLGEDLQVSLDEEFKVKSLGFVKSGKTIPVTPLAALQINFRGPSSVFPHISAEDVLSDNDKIEDPGNQELLGKSKSEILKDAYVLIGLSAVGVFDMRQFPFESNAPGVYGHANILDNILSQDPMMTGPSIGWSVWLLLLMIVGVSVFALCVETVDAVPALLVFLITISTIAFLDFRVMFFNNRNLNTVYLYLEVLMVFVLTLAMKYVKEERNKKFIRGAFAKYVAPVVVDSILKDPTKLSLGGEKRELTILFSDIRGFTTFSEQMDAKALASFLNDYLGIMTGLVFANQGTLDKYIGDAIMAFWGAPLHQPQHALNACKAAVDMVRALTKHQERFKTQYGIDVQIGMGINSGVVNVGNMGSEQNFEYTVIGDHVNLASRMEGLTKKYHATIVTSRFTFDCIKSAGEALPSHRVLDHVKVKGKKNAVELIELLDKEYPPEGLGEFQAGRDSYRACQWDEAVLHFQNANRLISQAFGVNDGPSEVYLERCEFFKKSPPEPGWDGSWEMDSK